jgi:serine/threonine-protein kinase ATR
MKSVPSNADESENTEQGDSESRGREQKRCELLSALGKLACAGSQCLQRVPGTSDHFEDMTCSLCDAAQTRPKGGRLYWDKSEYSEDWKNVVAALLAISGIQQFRESTKPRVYMALSLRRVFNHISDTEYLDLERSSLGEWLLASMSRSLRELRISAV